MAFSTASLERLSLCLSSIGVLFLFACTLFLEAREVSFYELDPSFVGERVVLKGRLLWLKNVKGTALFELTDELGLKRLKAVIFSPSEEQWLTLRQAGRLSLEGRIQEYEGELELVVERLALTGLDAG